MKNLKIILLFAVLMAVTITSCKKDKDVETQNQTSEKSYSQDILSKITNFKEKMNSDLKTSGEINIDDAIWNLEALICYEGAYPDSSSKKLKSFKSYYSIAIDNKNLVSENDVQSVYELMLDTIDYQLSQFNEEVKFLAFSDVKLVEIVNGTALIEATNAFGFNLVLGYYTPFTTNDDWIWGDNQGSCNSSPLTDPSDASDELQYKLNHPVLQVPGAGSYTDYETIELTTANLIVYNGVWIIYEGSNYFYCMNNTELTERLEGAHGLMYNYNDTSNDSSLGIQICNEEDEGARPEGKDVISIVISDEIVVGSLYQHIYNITYAKPWSISTN